MKMQYNSNLSSEVKKKSNQRSSEVTPSMSGRSRISSRVRADGEIWELVETAVAEAIGERAALDLRVRRIYLVVF